MIPERPEDNRQNALTSIHSAYTLATTHGNANELDEIAVKAFLEALAEVAMAVASRERTGGRND